MLKLLNQIIDGPMGRPLIYLAIGIWALLLIALWPIVIAAHVAFLVRDEVRRWREAIRLVDEGGDLNDKD